MGRAKKIIYVCIVLGIVTSSIQSRADGVNLSGLRAALQSGIPLQNGSAWGAGKCAIEFLDDAEASSGSEFLYFNLTKTALSIETTTPVFVFRGARTVGAESTHLPRLTRRGHFDLVNGKVPALVIEQSTRKDDFIPNTSFTLSMLTGLDFKPHPGVLKIDVKFIVSPDYRKTYYVGWAESFRGQLRAIACGY